jgi:DNA-binding NtrC family response regulator
MIEVPPLRVRLAETPEELGDLVGHLVGRILGAEDGVLAEAATAAIAEGFGPDYRWPGNVRELEQAVRRFVLSGHARPLEARVAPESPAEALLDAVRDGTLEARELVERYCAVLHARHGTFEEVARITGLDRRTVRKYVVGPYSEDGNG